MLSQIPQKNVYVRATLTRPPVDTPEYELFSRVEDEFLRTVRSPTPVDGWVKKNLFCNLYWEHPEFEALYHAWLDGQEKDSPRRQRIRANAAALMASYNLNQKNVTTDENPNGTMLLAWDSVHGSALMVVNETEYCLSIENDALGKRVLEMKGAIPQ
jgi:hypothetical protein